MRKNNKRKVVLEPLESRVLFSVTDHTALFKGAIFDQTSSSAPGTAASYFAGAEVDESVSGSTVNNATLIFPNSAQQDLSANNGSTSDFTTFGNFDNLSALDASASAGTYHITVNDQAGAHEYSLVMPVDNFPTPVDVTNFTALQSADSSQAITIDWAALTGGNSNSFVQLSFTETSTQNKIFATPMLGHAGSIPDTATSFTIPAGILQPGDTYSVEVIYGVPASEDSADYSAVPGFPAFASETDLSLVTQASSLTAPTNVQASQGNLPHHVQLTWAGVSGAQSYQVFRSADNNFIDAARIAGGITTTFFNDATALPGIQYFYFVRARNTSTIGPISGGTAGFIPLAAPINVVATNFTHHVQLTWNAVPNAGSYQIFRSTDDNPMDAIKISGGTNLTSFNDPTAVPGQSYFYFIRARNPSTGFGLFSAGVMGEVP